MMKLVLILVTLLVVVQSQTPNKFSAVVKILEDPNSADMDTSLNEYSATVHYDSVTEQVSYTYVATGNADLNGYKEVFDYKNRVQYKACSGCEAFKTGVMPHFHINVGVDTSSGGATINVPGHGDGRCQPFTKTDPAAAGGVQTVWINIPVPANAADYTTCKVRFTDGREIIFEAPAPLGLLPFTHKTCTAKCGAPLDLTFVIDESGSINPTEWGLMNQFIKGVIDQFTVGPTATHVAIAYFAGVTYGDSQDPANCCGRAESTLPMSSSRTSIDAVLDTHLKTGGHTCINCGMRAGARFYPNPNRAPAARQVMIVITDGYNNRETNYFSTDIARVRATAGGIETFAVGVSNSDAAQLVEIAGGNRNRVFRAPDFAGLVNQIGTISSAICNEFIKDTPCGLACKSKCVCGAKCVCPTKCTDPSACTKGKCVSGQGGCKSKPETCDPPKGTCRDVAACVVPTCTGVGGTCVDQTAPTCNALCAMCTEAAVQTQTPPDLCSCPSCDALTGVCSTGAPKDCNDNNACTKDRCVPATGQCENVPETCVGTNGKPDVCEVYTCDPVTACAVTPVDCSQTPPKTKCHVVECKAGTDSTGKAIPVCTQVPIGGLVDRCDNCKSDKLPCALGGSSAVVVSGLVTGLVIVTALLGGAFAVGIGACLAANAAGGAGSASAAPSAAASVNPLYEDGANSFDNPLADC